MSDERMELEPVNDTLEHVGWPPALQAIRAAIQTAFMDLEALDADGDLDGILVGIAMVDVIRRDLARLRSDAGNRAASRMGRDPIIMQGIGSFERKSDARRTTDWDAILSAIQNRALVDTDTGEMVDDPRVAVDRMANLVREIVPLYRSTSAKQAGLKAAAIPKDDVQDTEWRNPDVAFRPAK